MLVKKYGNRRLYDTEASRYMTLEDLTAKIRQGTDVRVVDARTNEDLTQETLTQIIIEGRGAERILPASLLHRLIRLRDDALADFLGKYVEGALELYLQARKTSHSLLPLNPMLALFTQQPFGSAIVNPPSSPPMASLAPSLPAPSPPGQVELLRREFEALKNSLRKRKR
jgi:polyhydroxyalkanoate synthesis repressor PhaR